MEEGELEDETGQTAQPMVTESLPASTAIPTLTSSIATALPQQSQSVSLRKEEEKSQQQQQASTSGVGEAEPGTSGVGGDCGEGESSTTAKRARQPIVWDGSKDGGGSGSKPPPRKIMRRTGAGQPSGTGRRNIRLKPPRK